MPWTPSTREPCPICLQTDKVQKYGINGGKQRWKCVRCDKKWQGLPLPQGTPNAFEAKAALKAERREEAEVARQLQDGSTELIEEIDRLLAHGREAVGDERSLLENLSKEYDRIIAREKRLRAERGEQQYADKYEDRRTPAQKNADREAHEERRAAEAAGVPVEGGADVEVVDAPEDADVAEEGESNG